MKPAQSTLRRQVSAAEATSPSLSRTSYHMRVRIHNEKPSRMQQAFKFNCMFDGSNWQWAFIRF